MPEHGVAAWAAGGRLLLMCECGWHVPLGDVTTADAIGELVAAHRADPEAGQLPDHLSLPCRVRLLNSDPGDHVIRYTDGTSRPACSGWCSAGRCRERCGCPCHVAPGR